ncbi:MAG: hypothetical protein JO072_01795 [Parafilimonas sp.]|nr:hypothetical protein [Parafilimonas sp.]
MKPINFLFAILFVFGCSPAKQIATSKQTFTYDYKTTNTVKPSSAGILVTLIRPYYADKFVQVYGEPDIFTNFQKFMGDDIEELLIDKGYRIKSTYPTFDNMTYDEKKEVDVALQIEIVPSFSALDGKWSSIKHVPIWANNHGGNVYYTYQFNGTVSLIGKINLYGLEPLSHEKIWIKSVPIPTIYNISLNTSGDLQKEGIDVNFLNDPNVYNSIGSALQKEYQSILSQIDTYLDPREFQDLKDQIKELKTKKVY